MTRFYSFERSRRGVVQSRFQILASLLHIDGNSPNRVVLTCKKKLYDKSTPIAC